MLIFINHIRKEIHEFAFHLLLLLKSLLSFLTVIKLNQILLEFAKWKFHEMRCLLVWIAALITNTYIDDISTLATSKAFIEVHHIIIATASCTDTLLFRLIFFCITIIKERYLGV